MEDSAGRAEPELYPSSSLTKNYFSEANMHRVTGGGPLLLQRRAEVMDAYSLLQHNHPALPPDLQDFQVCFVLMIASSRSSTLTLRRVTSL